MTDSTDSDSGSGLAGMGKWLAVASELPCMVISFLFVGQILGSSWGGPTVAIWGALLGAVIGFFVGVAGIFKTITYYDQMETHAKHSLQYSPPIEEILEDIEFHIDEEDSL